MCLCFSDDIPDSRQKNTSNYHYYIIIYFEYPNEVFQYYNWNLAIAASKSAAKFARL
jgi:hypothetical protein